MSYFNSSDMGEISSATIVNAATAAFNFEDYDEIDARAIEFPQVVFEHLDLWGLYEGDIFTCPRPYAKDPETEQLEVNVVSGYWIDHGEDDTSGFGMINLMRHLEGYTKAEAAVILKEWFDYYYIAASPYIRTPIELEINIRRGDLNGKLSFVREISEDKQTTIWSDLGIQQPYVAHPYNDAAGKAVAYTLQYKSKCIPCSAWTSEYTSEMSWQYLYPPGLRPLYNLDQLVANPDKPVLLVGSEKAANAAQELFPFHVVTTVMGGIGAINKADWLPLYGRQVTIWLNDQVGAANVAKCLHKGDENTQVWNIPPLSYLPELTEGGNLKVRSGAIPGEYDAAKAILDGWTADLMGMLPDSMFQIMKPVFEPQRVGNYLVKEDGVYYTYIKDGEDHETLISSRVQVTALTRDAHNNNWGLLLQFIDRDRFKHEWAMPKELLASKDEYRQVLLARGADLYPGGKDRFADYLFEANPDARALCVSTQGWHDGVFVLPNKSYGKSDERVILQTANARKVSPYSVKGTLPDWQENIGSKCVGNSRIILAVCVSLAGPFLDPLKLENGGFHFRGQSSSGKTKTLSVAASIWGGKEMVRVWRATGNAIESLAREHNDSVLLLDELGQVAPQEAGDIAYTLGNGQSKARSNVNGDAKEVATWRLLFISTGEIGLAEHVASGGGNVKAGQEIRMLDIPSDASKGMGVFENLHGANNAAMFADSLQTLSETWFGSPADALLTKVSEPGELQRATDTIRKVQADFVSKYVPTGAHGQVTRAAQRFGAVAGVGEYCISIGIFPWDSGHAVWGVRECFLAWLESRGDNSATEEIRALAQVHEILERDSESRFTLIEAEGLENNIGQRTINRLGFRHILDDGSTEHWVLPEAYNKVLCRGRDPKLVSRVLKEMNALELDSAGKSSITKLVPGLGRIRVYVIKASFMQTDEE